MRKIILLFVCFEWSLAVLPQVPLITVYGRHTTSLQGKWNYIIDPYETGYAGFHGEVYDERNPRSAAAYFNNYHPADKKELVEYDFDKSPSMQIPGDWNTQHPALLYYEGSVWFKRSFDYRLPAGKKLFVHFGAVNYDAAVYLNGQKLGVHEGGFTPFAFDITDVVKPAGNYLILKVDNRRRKDGVPTLNTDWWNYGGITRDVLLIEEPGTCIADYSIQLKKGDRNTIAGWVQLNGAAQQETISLQIDALNIAATMTTDDKGRASFEIPATKIKYWSPEDPHLYTVGISTRHQTLKDEIGFRTIETRGPDILLNGKPVFLRGISIHEDYKGHRVRNEAEAIALLNHARELGCNFIRLAHYPHNESMVRQAEKMGLLLWEEVPVYWTIDFQNEKVFDNAAAQLRSVMTRDRNRAAVIIWSVANETPYSPARNTFLKRMVGIARSTDSSRLVSAALLTRYEKGENIVDDEMGNYFDVVAFNQYRGWYGGDLATAPEAIWKIPFQKPVIVSEFGGDAKQGLHGTKDERWTEEYQEYLYRQNLLMIEKMPNIRGISPWILMDFRSPRRVLPGIQAGFNRKGLVSSEGKKKKAFRVLQEYYRQKKQQYTGL